MKNGLGRFTTNAENRKGNAHATGRVDCFEGKDERMKVKDLKEHLANMPDDSDVCFNIADGCCGDYLELEISEVYGMGDLKFLTFLFNALPGYRSCIQAGRTKSTDEEYWKDKPNAKHVDAKEDQK